jgi:hypothetical protein
MGQAGIRWKTSQREENAGTKSKREDCAKRDGTGKFSSIDTYKIKDTR